MRKGKVFVILLIIGLCCVLVAPNYVCDPQGTSCAAIVYVGYGALGICGLIVLYQVIIFTIEMCKCFLDCCCKCCQCCCQCLFPRRWQSQSDRLLDNGELQSDNYEAQDVSEGDVPPPYFYQQESVEQQIEEEWQQDFRQTFHQHECTICLDVFQDQYGDNVTDVVVRMRCGHKFHRVCINDWLQKNENCPICRKVIS